MQRQESELQEAHSLPLRNYLMKYVMPSLTEAMVECTKIDQSSSEEKEIVRYNII